MENFNKSQIGLKRTDMANMFNAYKDGNDVFFYHGRTLTFGNINKLNEKYVNKHIWKDGDTWHRLAHQYYEDSKLWWIICRANDIKNPLNDISNDTIINIPTKGVVQNIINKISK
jgi:nucleoid-associated protein YgaU